MTLLAVLIFFTIVIVYGLAGVWLPQILHNLFLFYSILLGAVLFFVAYALSHVLSRLATERKLLVRLVSWVILASLCFSLTLFTLVYVLGPIEQKQLWVYDQTIWSLTVPKNAFWTWLEIFPLNVIMLSIWIVGILAGIAQEDPSLLGYAVARAERKSILTLYVKSVQTREEIVTPDRESEIAGTLGPHYYRGTPMGDGDIVPVDEFIFPEDQEELIEMVKEKAPEHSFSVRVVDLTREEPHHIVKTIPTLISDSGKRLEGRISEEQLETFLQGSELDKRAERKREAISGPKRAKR
jgi:hypothetical protein